MLVAAVLLDVFRGEVGAWRASYGGGDLLAVLLVGDAVDLDVADLGVGVEELLDLARVDVLAAADDHVLRPARDPDVPVLVHDREVPGVQPALLVYDLVGLVVHLVVALHDVVAARPELALLAGLAPPRPYQADDLTSTSGSARPTVETRISSGSSVRVWVMTGLDSVWP